MSLGDWRYQGVIRNCNSRKKTDIARGKRKRQTLQGPKEKDRHCKCQMKKTDIARAKRKRQTLQGPKETDRHCKGQKKKTDIARAKRNRQTLGQKKKTDIARAKRKRQTLQGPKEKVQKEQQWRTKYYTETYKFTNMNPTQFWGKVGCSGRVNSSSSTSSTRCIIVKRHEHRLKWKSC